MAVGELLQKAFSEDGEQIAAYDPDADVEKQQESKKPTKKSQKKKRGKKAKRDAIEDGDDEDDHGSDDDATGSDDDDNEEDEKDHEGDESKPSKSKVMEKKEDADDEAKESERRAVSLRSREELFGMLADRVHDTSSYTRSKVLQVWTTLIEYSPISLSAGSFRTRFIL